MPKPTAWMVVWATAAVIVSFNGSSLAGVRRHDVEDNEYLNLAAQPEFSAVGMVHTNSRDGSGTLIDDFWVLTAAHLLPSPTTTSVTFNLNGDEYTVAEWIPHPDWRNSVGTNGFDVGLLRLSESIEVVAPALRYRGTTELGRIGTIVGFGLEGTGLTGQREPAGVKRAGQNVLDVLGSAAGQSDSYLMSDFDSPPGTYSDPDRPSDSSFGSAEALGLEYASARGDSGGGVFIEEDGMQ